MKRSTWVVKNPIKINHKIMITTRTIPETSLFSSSMAVLVSFNECASSLRSLYTFTTHFLKTDLLIFLVSAAPSSSGITLSTSSFFINRKRSASSMYFLPGFATFLKIL
uniref:Uncharacterized protein MANES_16G097400 n=1 Tax=Rhizophora mucronata TaxID=61149 RepID=A0A2P2N0U6_RHIMU